MQDPSVVRYVTKWSSAGAALRRCLSGPAACLTTNEWSHLKGLWRRGSPPGAGKDARTPALGVALATRTRWPTLRLDGRCGDGFGLLSLFQLSRLKHPGV